MSAMWRLATVSARKKAQKKGEEKPIAREESEERKTFPNTLRSCHDTNGKGVAGKSGGQYLSKNQMSGKEKNSCNNWKEDMPVGLRGGESERIPKRGS